MEELTKKEALATVGAIEITLDLLNEVVAQKSNELKDATDTLWVAKSKIEKIYQEHE